MVYELRSNRINSNDFIRLKMLFPESYHSEKTITPLHLKEVISALENNRVISVIKMDVINATLTPVNFIALNEFKKMIDKRDFKTGRIIRNLNYTMVTVFDRFNEFHVVIRDKEC